MSFLQGIINTMNKKAPPPGTIKQGAPASAARTGAAKVPPSPAKATIRTIPTPATGIHDTERAPETALSADGVFEVTNGSKRRKLTEDVPEEMLDDAKRAEKLEKLRAEKAKWDDEERKLSELQGTQAFLPEATLLPPHELELHGMLQISLNSPGSPF
jgi:hypothetical protein